MVRTSRLAARLFPLLTRTKWKNLYFAEQTQVTRSRQKYMSCCVATMATNVKKDVEQPYLSGRFITVP
jgi:hypothetical protein